jgi:alanine racemase
MSDNIKIIRKQINREKPTKLLAVLKANAYGHGAVESALLCQKTGVDMIGVACAREGAALRAAGVFIPILIFGVALGGDVEAALRHNLIQTVGDATCAEQISAAAVRLNRTADVHIQVDTGMAWIGFPADESGKAAIRAVSGLPNVNVAGIYSHLAESDKPAKGFSMEQLDGFKRFIGQLADVGLDIPFRHIANSGAILGGADAYGLSMVRAGISVYGLHPASSPYGADEIDNLGFKPALTLKSKVAHVKWMDENQSIGYSRTYFTTKRAKIAVVSAGYADGYFRGLSNRGRVIINGEYAPVVGNVCMDHFMADVTDIPDVRPGSDVTLIGQQGGKSVTAEELAELCGTINYEIITNISERVPRVFV